MNFPLFGSFCEKLERKGIIKRKMGVWMRMEGKRKIRIGRKIGFPSFEKQSVFHPCEIIFPPFGKLFSPFHKWQTKQRKMGESILWEIVFHQTKHSLNCIIVYYSRGCCLYPSLFSGKSSSNNGVCRCRFSNSCN